MVEIDELIKIVEIINDFYHKISEDWGKEDPDHFNQANTEVRSVGGRVLLDILKYREFLNKKTLDMLELTNQDFINRARVKSPNSIYFKLFTYATKRVNGEKGSIPINKCFNDIFGLRILTAQRYELKQVVAALKNKFPNIKCIDSSKGDYKAIHIYFKLDNFHYQWELQIWYYGDENRNLESHAKHKQMYTTWEKLFNEKK